MKGRQPVQRAIATLLAAAPLLACAAPDAEYAMRWNPQDGGPADPAQVFALLQLAAGKQADFEVRYFEVQAPADAPAGFRPILRERVRGGKTETTWKYRGGAAAAPGDEASWACPLLHASKRKDEVDVSVLSAGEVRRAYARSCTAEVPLAQAVSPALQARPLGCASRMRRQDSADKALTVEHWRLSNGSVVLELSGKGPDKPKALQAFRARVALLLAKGVQPLDRSKTDIGTQCAKP